MIFRCKFRKTTPLKKSCCTELVRRINNSNSLLELLECHKFAWSQGFQNKNLGPNKYGMFRTNSIPEMTPEEVYLGNIWGLWTQNIPFWESCNDEKVYKIIFNQYQRLLKSNIEYLMRNNEM